MSSILTTLLGGIGFGLGGMGIGSGIADILGPVSDMVISLHNTSVAKISGMATNRAVDAQVMLGLAQGGLTDNESSMWNNWLNRRDQFSMLGLI